MKIPPALLSLTVVALLLRPALYAQTPGGVNSNLSLWVKANLGAAPAGGGTLTAWTDQTGINSFTLNTTGVVPIPPAIVLNAVNFNPAIHQKKTVLIKNNPVYNNHLELLLGKPVSAGMQINIFNAEGKQVLAVNRPLTPFGSQVVINIGLLPGGLYFVHIPDGDDASTTTFIKQ